jgi:hypothetical protein
MVRLGEHLALHKTRSETLTGIKNLNLWGNDLDDVSLVSRMPNLEVCSLSVNAIGTLRFFRGAPGLRELYLRKNSIKSLWELKYLQGLRGLEVLWLSENPVADQPLYRQTVLQALPQLLKLDNREIDDEERRSANLVPIAPELLPGVNLTDEEVDRLSAGGSMQGAAPARPAAAIRTDSGSPEKRRLASGHPPQQERQRLSQGQAVPLDELTTCGVTGPAPASAAQWASAPPGRGRSRHDDDAALHSDPDRRTAMSASGRDHTHSNGREHGGQQHRHFSHGREHGHAQGGHHGAHHGAHHGTHHGHERRSHSSSHRHASHHHQSHHHHEGGADAAGAGVGVVVGPTKGISASSNSSSNSSSSNSSSSGSGSTAVTTSSSMSGAAAARVPVSARHAISASASSVGSVGSTTTASSAKIHAEDSPVLYATVSLLNVLDEQALRTVRAEIDVRLAKLKASKK